jgi:methylaspartate ammonia-lyase
MRRCRPKNAGHSNVQIRDVIFAAGQGGYYSDDQAAVRRRGRRNGFLYRGRPVTPGFRSIRSPAEVLGIGMVLSDGTVCWGDAMTVQYAAAGGREPPLDAEALEGRLRQAAVPFLIGLEVTGFRAALDVFSGHLAANGDIPKSGAYGMTQALLVAAAYCQRRSMAEVVSEEYGFPLIARPVPILSQSGEDREVNVDKMILRRADVLPHGLINSPDLIGPRGETLRNYVVWLRDRISRHGPDGYRPRLHLDVYGGLGRAFDRVDALIGFLLDLEAQAAPLALTIESPADFGGRDEQVAGLAEIRRRLRTNGSTVRIVADEWCNTLDDVEAFAKADAADLIQLKMPDMGSLDDTIRGIRLCRSHGIGVYLGGSSTETDLSARISVHIAVAAQADMMLAKPGMGVDEGYVIVGNEQRRLLSMLRWRMGVDAPEGAQDVRAVGV